MTVLRVWAPDAERVDVCQGTDTTAMLAADDGWWAVDVDANRSYGFALEGGPVLADPRSRWQPDGVHGLSRYVDLDSFDWQATAWQGRTLLGRVVYEVHVGTFTEEGTFDAAIDHLDHLVDLGIDFVELLPVAAFPGEHGWGYDGVFLYAVHDAYGGPYGLARFVDACHLRGIGVLLDVVYNHLGPDGNVLMHFGPYFTDVYATPWGPAVNFSGRGSDEVRRYFIDNALMWLRDYRIDGLRLDAIHAIVDDAATHLLEQLAVEVGELSVTVGRPLSLIAESDLNDPRIVVGRDAGGYGLDAQWSDDFHHALHAMLTAETAGYYEDFGPLGDLATALQRGFVFTGQYSLYRDRRHGRPLPPTVSAHRLVGYAQDHDQIGNRARGDRLPALVSTELVKVAAAIVLTSPFTPMLFMGEEWAASTPWQYFTDHQNDEVAEAVRVGRRAEFTAFGWHAEDVPDPQDPQTFARSHLRWDELPREPHAEVLRWHRELIALRRSNADLANGRFDQLEVEVDEAQRSLLLRRPQSLVVANFGPIACTIDIDATHLLLTSSPDVDWRAPQLTIPPESVAIFAR
ncbi:MAG TPA: malto-oligosyltrehalose trehalohydrolase [Acidothermaceae bacterium]